VKLVAPTINLNGTAGEDLLREYGEAAQALKKAQRALEAATCNGRDFPNPAELRKAIDAKSLMVGDLQKMRSEVEDVAVELSDQLNARNARKRR